MKLWNSIIEDARQRPQVFLNWGMVFAVVGLLGDFWMTQLLAIFNLVVAYKAWPEIDWEALEAEVASENRQA